MSKHFHDVRNVKKLLAWGRVQRMGPFQGMKKAVPGTANTRDGKGPGHMPHAPTGPDQSANDHEGAVH